jgi:predicted alpha/beta hydrolase family esterase
MSEFTTPAYDIPNSNELKVRSMHTFITLPGMGGSGDAHWQSLWERANGCFKRFEPSSWDEPELSNWIDAVDKALMATKTNPVLVAHSLGCLLVAHWARRSIKSVAGAFLVSVPDPAGPEFPVDAASFRDVPAAPLPFPALIVTSTNDPYATIAYSESMAESWRTGLVEVGALGHINASSGLGDWPQGRQLLDAFCAGLGDHRQPAGQLVR